MPKMIYDNLIKVIPERVKSVIANSDMTQAEFAREIICVSPEHFTRTYKKGEIYQEWINRICDTCNISPDYLTGDIDEPITRFEEKPQQDTDTTLIFKSYSRLLLRDLKDIKEALQSQDYKRAIELTDNLITDTQKDIEDAN